MAAELAGKDLALVLAQLRLLPHSLHGDPPRDELGTPFAVDRKRICVSLIRACIRG